MRGGERPQEGGDLLGKLACTRWFLMGFLSNGISGSSKAQDSNDNLRIHTLKEIIHLT